MAITDISISEELQTNAPSIKYRGNEGPKSPQEMEMMMKTSVDDPFYRSGDEDEHSFRMFKKPYKELNADELEEFKEEMERLMNKFSGGENNRVRELLLKEETEGLSEDEKEELRELIKTISAQGPILPSDEDPINPFGPKPEGPVLPDRQMAAYGGIMGMDGRKQYGIGSFFQKMKDKVVDDIIPNEIKENPLLTAAAVAAGDYYLNDRSYLDNILKGTTEFITGGEDKPNVIKRILDKETGDNRTIGGDILGSISKNILPIVGGIGAGLFTKNQPDQQTGMPSDQTAINLQEYKKAANLLDQKQGLTADMNFLPTVASRKYSPEEMAVTYAQAANGGRIGMAEGGLMDLGGMEKDYRAEGGFVPIGREEKADDVPARLSVNEFVFTADAVRNAGGGDIDQGAKVMENMMKHLEAGGQVSEESQGMAGARDMFEVSERLSEVV